MSLVVWQVSFNPRMGCVERETQTRDQSLPEFPLCPQESGPLPQPLPPKPLPKLPNTVSTGPEWDPAPGPCAPRRMPCLSLCRQTWGLVLGQQV